MNTNTKRIQLLAMCLASAFCAQAALAQQTDDTRNQQHQKKDKYGQATAAKGGLQLSKLIGAQIRSNTGENLGKLEDVVVDPQTGRITFAIMGKGGVIGLGEKHLPVPWQALSLDSQKRLTLNTDQEKMRTAPTVESGYAELDNPDFVLVVCKFYEIQPAGSGASGETPGGTGSGSSKSETNSVNPNP